MRTAAFLLTFGAALWPLSAMAQMTPEAAERNRQQLCAHLHAEIRTVISLANVYFGVQQSHRADAERMVGRAQQNERDLLALRQRAQQTQSDIDRSVDRLASLTGVYERLRC